MVLGDDDVICALGRAQEDGVRGLGVADVQDLGTRGVDRGLDTLRPPRCQKIPPSLAWGSSPATAIRGRAIPRARQASWAMWMTSSTRRGVTRAIASAQGNVGADMDDAQVRTDQEHADPLRSGPLGQ